VCWAHSPSRSSSSSHRPPSQSAAPFWRRVRRARAGCIISAVGRSPHHPSQRASRTISSSRMYGAAGRTWCVSSRRG
jgi:hypothetical protein